MKIEKTFWANPGKESPKYNAVEAHNQIGIISLSKASGMTDTRISSTHAICKPWWFKSNAAIHRRVGFIHTYIYIRKAIENKYKYT